MPHTRRQFLSAGLAGTGLLLLPGFAHARVSKPLKILVLGGTGFLGPHFVEAAQARGHTLTLFNRGKTNPGLFPDIEQLRGDRKSDLSALKGRRWDAVLDTSAYVPADVTRSTRLLAKTVEHYLIVSTISVYAKMDTPGMDENAPLAQLADPTVTEVNGETYGGLKALCEQAAQAEMPGKVTVVRPGLIVGPGDPTDRFTYWPARADRGGMILAPETPDAPTQFIDVRDLAAFLLHLMEGRALGVFNADAPAGSLTMGRLLAACQTVAREMNTVACVRAPCPQPPGFSSELVWVPADFLKQQQVGAWRDLPCWIPARGEYAGFGQISTKRAQSAGLVYRPLEQTVRDTLTWWRDLPAERRAQPKAGLSPEREAAVLALWREKSSGQASI